LIFKPTRQQKAGSNVRFFCFHKARADYHVGVTDEASSEKQVPSFREALRFWIKLGFISFGGPAAQIALMHREIVEKRRWLSESHFRHALNFCLLLPGPEAQQLATYLGWRMHGAKGAFAAGIWFILPAYFIMLGLSWMYVNGANMPAVQPILSGLLAAAIALVLDALLRIGKKSLRQGMHYAIALTAFFLLVFAKVSFFGIIVDAALVGYFLREKTSNQAATEPSVIDLGHSSRPTWSRALRISAVGIAAWITPLLICVFMLGKDHTITQMGVFFSKAAMVTFGGAYAVLPYVAQQAVEHHQWLTHEQMIAGLALAETTPGPLIMVLEFVGFTGAWHAPGHLPAALAAWLGATLTVWCTFVPCFLFVFLGAPHIETIGNHPRLRAMMQAISAAVVGVIAQLLLTLMRQILFITENQQTQFVWPLIILSAAAFVAIRYGTINIMAIIGLCALGSWVMM
jgi:chromate transporter